MGRLTARAMIIVRDGEEDEEVCAEREVDVDEGVGVDGTAEAEAETEELSIELNLLCTTDSVVAIDTAPIHTYTRQPLSHSYSLLRPSDLPVTLPTPFLTPISQYWLNTSFAVDCCAPSLSL